MYLHLRRRRRKPPRCHIKSAQGDQPRSIDKGCIQKVSHHRHERHRRPFRGPEVERKVYLALRPVQQLSSNLYLSLLELVDDPGTQSVSGGDEIDQIIRA